MSATMLLNYIRKLTLSYQTIFLETSSLVYVTVFGTNIGRQSYKKSAKST